MKKSSFVHNRISKNCRRQGERRRWKGDLNNRKKVATNNKLKEVQVKYEQEKSRNKQLEEELSTFKESMKKDIEGITQLQQQFEKKEEMMMKKYKK